MKKNVYLQYLRAISIMSVVIIHSLPTESNGTVIIRQLINFCVAMFLFLSGYLTNVNNDNLKDFYKNRIVRVVIPYVIWSFVYIIIDQDFNMISIISKMITGQACGAFYYIIVYIQLVLLTPIISKVIKNKKYKYLGIITPITILILYLSIFLEHPILFPYNVLNFFVWFIFYYYGMQVRYFALEVKLKENITKNAILYVIFIMLSLIEGFIWDNHGDFSMAVSQIKISSIFASMFFINIAIGISGRISVNMPLLKNIGDYSFGIYLIHLLFIQIIKNKVQSSAIMILLTMVSCYIVIAISNKLLSKKLCQYLGFK